MARENEYHEEGQTYGPDQPNSSRGHPSRITRILGSAAPKRSSAETREKNLMLFRFTTFNHCRQGQIIVEDIARILGGQLLTLGHEVAWSNDGFVPGRDAMNVVLESFADDPRTIERMVAARFAGCRFLIVATEEPTAAGFN